MINVFNLSEKERSILASNLIDYLKDFAIKDFYLNENQLQDDFEKFMAKDYANEVLADFENDNNVSLSKVMKLNRFKICSECNEPFISIDLRNKGTVCSRYFERQFTKNGKEINAERSLCWIKRNQRHSNTYARGHKHA